MPTSKLPPRRCPSLLTRASYVQRLGVDFAPLTIASSIRRPVHPPTGRDTPNCHTVDIYTTKFSLERYWTFLLFAIVAFHIIKSVHLASSRSFVNCQSSIHIIPYLTCPVSVARLGQDSKLTTDRRGSSRWQYIRSGHGHMRYTPIPSVVYTHMEAAAVDNLKTEQGSKREYGLMLGGSHSLRIRGPRKIRIQLTGIKRVN